MRIVVSNQKSFDESDSVESSLDRNSFDKEVLDKGDNRVDNI